MSKAVAVTMMKVLLTCYSFLWEEEMKLDWLVRSSLNLILCQVHMICAKWGYFHVWNGVAWLGRVHCPGHPLLLLVVQTCRKLALFAQKGESTDAICNLSLCLAASELAPTLHASGPFLTWFLHQPPLKGTFSMQENIKAVFTCRFPLRALFLFSLGDLNTSQNSIWGWNCTRAAPALTVPAAGTEGRVCVSVHVRVRAEKQMCAVQNKWGYLECHKTGNLWPVSAISQSGEVRRASIKSSLFCIL